MKEIVENYPNLFLKPRISINKGWIPLVTELLDAIEWRLKFTGEKTKIVQIKQKFGGLRVWVEPSDDFIKGMVHLTEAMSYNICEYCGTNENLGRTQEGYIATCCRKCAFDNDLKEWKIK